MNTDSKFDITKQVEEHLRQNNLNITIAKPFTFSLKVMALDRYTESPYLSGAILGAKIEGEFGKDANGIFEPWLSSSIFEDEILFHIVKKENEFSLKREILEKIITACNLLDFDWYRKFFKNVFSRTDCDSCIVHNGVLCGRSVFLTDSLTSLPGIILLKDKYRPVLGMSRNEVREMPLEALCDMAAIWNIAHEQNYLFSCTSQIRVAKPSEVTFECMKTTLEKRRDIEEKVILKTNKGNFKICELSEKLHKTNEPYILKIGSVFLNNNGFIEPDDVYQLMIRYYIQEKYLIRARPTRSFDCEICIIDFSNAQNEKEYSVFPPCFFIEPYDDQFNCIRYQTIDQTNGQTICMFPALNSNHRLSRFLIKNGVDIKKHAPGIFSKLMSLLAHGSGLGLPSEINKQLKYLRKLVIESHENYFGVDDSLLLTKNDFD